MAEPLHICPSCGCNLRADPEIEAGPWRLTPDSAFLDGAPFQLTAQQNATLYAVAAGRGKWLSPWVILDRVSDSDEPNVVAVVLSRVRKRLGARMPVESNRGRGYRWRLPEQDNHSPAGRTTGAGAAGAIHAAAPAIHPDL
ncbi:MULTISPECIES: winged helix-turn-helix domain-containing protein [unclassified Novosphingobium]|uniref:winged helix-turn-helix domain-containing protein n=1 Tax=unclassified Novosphingobium TaxID=2644732 RepID=UPI000D305BFB|nr:MULTISPECIES: winged helix-turn-helix domain-containing protein [unclassified Novosphingobium]PTR06409.1 transcriptional regulator [Novosphingobium sp. GV055]PUA94828.1 transcriptional regulator [Novosphingobium sp. GV061]PUB13753.1 transcriptional regulator [Novosphingobium sp. GV079]PUB38451.1 transcriptional regulator [Novosphingobium sp. GV027]